jgi:hypothetical protein
LTSPHYQRVIEDEHGNKKDYNPWYPALDWIDFTKSTWFSRETKEFDAYILSLYHSVLFIGQNELGPVNTIEIVVAITLLMTNLFVNMKLFADLGLILDKLSARDIQIQDQYDSGNQVMANMELPSDLAE